MSTNDILCEIHAALVAKARERCKVEGNNKAALEIADAVMAYGKLWSEAFANDGAIDDLEEKSIVTKGECFIRFRIPSIDNAGVKIAWNGLSLFGIGWVGLKAKLSEWFGLSLACVALCVCAVGCKTYYENAGMRVRAGSVTAPIEVSEPTSSTNIRLLFFLDGVDLYATKGSTVEMFYYTASGGSWLTGAKTQAVEVVVSPVLTNLVTRRLGADTRARRPLAPDPVNSPESQRAVTEAATISAPST